MKKKYELTQETIEEDGYILHRIRAIKNFGDIKAGDCGGYIESESNLSHEGKSWIYNDAKVYEFGWVFDSAKISDNAKIYGDAYVCGCAHVFGNAQVCGCAEVWGIARLYFGIWNTINRFHGTKCYIISTTLRKELLG